MKKRINKNISEITLEEKEIIIKKYLSGNSMNSLSKEFKYNVLEIRDFFVKNQIPIRNHEQSRRKYNINHNFFDSIDCQEKAYILGFLFSDGNIGKNNNRIVLALQELDKEILEKINSLIQPEKPLYFSKKEKQQNIFKMQIHSAHMREKLIKLGCLPNKTRLLEFPTLIDDKFINSFVRGYLDGDGHIGPKHTHFIVHETFLKGFYNCIYKNTGLEINAYKSKYSPGFYNIFIGGIQRSIVFLNWIYKDSSIHMERKYKTYQSLLKYEKRPINYTKKTPKLTQLFNPII